VTAGRFDLVLTDINLPGVDGLEVLRAAKAADKDTCVILITGYASTTTAIDALRQGAYDYITKPFDLWETAKAIDRGLESRFLVIENRRLVESLEKANLELHHHEQILSRMVKDATQRITALYESGKEISTSLSRQATLDVIVNQVAKLAGAESSLVFLYDTDAGQYVAEAGAGAPQEGLKEYRFGAVVSHEVRTPLTSIKGSLELLGDERFHVLPPPQKELLSICQANTERLISLINDILDFSKLESSKLSLNFETFDVGRVVPEA